MQIYFIYFFLILMLLQTTPFHLCQTVFYYIEKKKQII